MAQPTLAFCQQLDFVLRKVHTVRQNTAIIQNHLVPETLNDTLAVFCQRIFLVDNAFGCMYVKTDPVPVLFNTLFQRRIRNRQAGMQTEMRFYQWVNIPCHNPTNKAAVFPDTCQSALFSITVSHFIT